MEDENEVCAFVAQITLGDLLNGEVHLPPTVQRYCAKHPRQQLRGLMPSSLEEFVVPGLPLKEQTERFEKTVVRRALRLSSGNRMRASAMLSITRATLWNKMSKWGWIK